SGGMYSCEQVSERRDEQFPVSVASFGLALLASWTRGQRCAAFSSRVPMMVSMRRATTRRQPPSLMYHWLLPQSAKDVHPEYCDRSSSAASSRKALNPASPSGGVRKT